MALLSNHSLFLSFLELRTIPISPFILKKWFSTCFQYFLVRVGIIIIDDRPEPTCFCYRPNKCPIGCSDVLNFQLSQSTMCGGVAINHTIIRSSKKKFFSNLANVDKKYFWKSVKVLNKNRDTIPSLHLHGTSAVHDSDKANMLNQFFARQARTQVIKKVGYMHWRKQTQRTFRGVWGHAPPGKF